MVVTPDGILAYGKNFALCRNHRHSTSDISSYLHRIEASTVGLAIYCLKLSVSKLASVTDLRLT